MFGFGKKNKPKVPVASQESIEGTVQENAEISNNLPPSDNPQPSENAVVPEKPASLFSRLKKNLVRTRSGLAEGLGALLLGKKSIDQNLLDEIETQLLMADVGMTATMEIIDELTSRLKRNLLSDSQALYQALVELLGEMLAPCEAPLVIPEELDKPFVILMVGVNGVGKTTTIGKLTRQFLAQNKSVMLAAGDTFRAAAVEQLQTWGERNNVPVVAQHTGADSASVIFDAYQSARAKQVDILIADTAGRLHNKDNLMQELEKVVRVLKKLDEDVPQEIMLVLDATTGQNALSQARSFGEAVNVSGLVISKLDGTAKGGMVFAIARELGLPLRFIGIGEKVEDLRPFEAKAFVDALFSGPLDEATQSNDQV